jgi:glucokinase
VTASPGSGPDPSPGHGGARSRPVTLGVDLGGTGTRVVALDPGGAVIRSETFRTAEVAAPGHDARGRSSGALQGLLARLAGVGRDLDVAGVGIGASGPVAADGIIDNVATLPAYTGLDLCSFINGATGWRCVIDNDAAAAAAGEYAYGAGRGSRTCVVVTLGTGIGVGVVTGGELFRAGDGTHPETGHIAVHEAPVPCYCGLPHCWEQAASRTALERLTGAACAAVTPAEAASAARGGDAGARRAFERYGVQLAAGLGTLLTVFRPDRVVLGGSAAQYLDLFAAALTAALGRQAPYQWTPPILAAELGDLAGAVGAAVLARLFSWLAGGLGAGMSRWTVLPCWRNSTTSCAVTQPPSGGPGSSGTNTSPGRFPLGMAGAACCGLA